MKGNMDAIKINTIETVMKGKQLYEKLVDFYGVYGSSYFIGVFSSTREMNIELLKLLPVIMERRKASNFLIVTDDEDMEAYIHQMVRVPFTLHLCTKEEAVCLTRYYLEIEKKRRGRFFLVGDKEPCDKRYMDLIAQLDISFREMLIYCELGLGSVPTDEELKEMEHSVNNKPPVKPIRWREMRNFIPHRDGQLGTFPRNVEMEIDKLLQKRVISQEHKVFIFSDTKMTAHILGYLKDYNIVGILDNDVQKRGQQREGFFIYHPSDVLQGEHRDDYRIIVPTRSYRPICENLNYYGYEIEKQVFIIYQENFKFEDKVDLVAEYIEDVSRGKEIYDSLREVYPTEKIYVCPYPGTGDMYLIGMYLKDRMEYDHIRDCVVVVSSASCKKILSLIETGVNIKQIVVLDGKHEAEQLIYYVRGIGYDRMNLFVLNNDYEMYAISCMSGLRNIDFNLMFQKVIFHAKERRTKVALRGRSADDIFEKNGLRKGRTVLLSPYANTAKKLPLDMWKQIVTELKKRDFDVCTNVSGSEEEAIEGTRGIFIPYDQIIDFLNQAGGFLGYRSGLCDIVSATDAKKVIFYPEGKSFIFSSYYNYFSLEKMGIAKGDLLELEIGEESRDILPFILNFMTMEEKKEG